ncbi:prepilin-type N-terminal cleavage/methylation domain-containing protein [Robertmurraya korlensis]|uniref:competence type IV pilus major pilin ComGC n=1 Tax=Robertmurraya korlensis TaxID=519977 RepID=UPI00203EB176|nr:competence type IV pilus major pilin ComGC [Robertmurraya korlensis]MCM3599603.1 prepilin-type N-terminal cleavage/methylation domain-containing protein [Robertmurraya korlensis]
MKKFIQNEKAFTLIEMMIVLLVISVLLIIAVPNISKHNSNIKEKGCEAFIKMVEAQVQSFEMEKNRMPTGLAELQTEGYLKENQSSCPNGDVVTISSSGTVTANNE